MRSHLPVVFGLPAVLLMLSSTHIGAASAHSETLMDCDPTDSVRVSDPVVRFTLKQAVRGADAWLQKPACRQIFTDFADASGRSLAEAMNERGLTPRARLRGIFFYDGAQQPACQSGRVGAFTSRGSAVIFVCERFAENKQSPVSAQVAVVHELLHTLGLGENPPTSAEINQRVRERCAR
jgi:hypothetical protein